MKTWATTNQVMSLVFFFKFLHITYLDIFSSNFILPLVRKKKKRKKRKNVLVSMNFIILEDMDRNGIQENATTKK